MAACDPVANGSAHSRARASPEGFRQNTDPWVFGNSFLYSNCKQLTPRGNPSALQGLSRGSLVLFGSSTGGRFVIDTVFVVAEGVCTFTPASDNPLPAAFRECTFDSYGHSMTGTAPQPSLCIGARHLRNRSTRCSASCHACAPVTKAHVSRGRRSASVGWSMRIASNRRAARKVPRPLAEVGKAWRSVVDQVVDGALVPGVGLAEPDKRNRVSCGASGRAGTSCSG